MRIPHTPPVYRPHKTSPALQPKISGKPATQTRQPPRQPVVPAVYRPQVQQAVVQRCPKPYQPLSAHSPQRPVVPPVYRPGGSPPVVQKKQAGGPPRVIQCDITIAGQPYRTSELEESLLPRVAKSRDGQTILKTLQQRDLLTLIEQRDGSNYDKFDKFTKVLLADAKQLAASRTNASSQPIKSTVIGKAKENLGRYDFRDIFDQREADEAYYKLALYADAYHERGEASHLLRLMDRALRTPSISVAGLKKTLSTLASTWAHEPSHYHRGSPELSGSVITFKGLIAELEALLYAGGQTVAPGEMVQSGARFGSADVEEDVDVSFIDPSGRLVLIESGADLNVLKNKLSKSNFRPEKHKAPKSQKQRYQYLVNRSGALTRRSQGAEHATPLKLLAADLCYSVPKDVYDDLWTREGLDVVLALIRADASLIVGVKKYSLADLRALSEAIRDYLEVDASRFEDLYGWSASGIREMALRGQFRKEAESRKQADRTTVSYIA